MDQKPATYRKTRLSTPLALLALAGLAALGGCGKNGAQNPQTPPQASQPTTTAQQRPSEVPTDSLAESPDQPKADPQPTPQAPGTAFTQLGITDLTVGDGEAVQPNAIVTVHYRGTFRESGEQFDASYDRGQPATFSLEPGALIKGFSEGLLGMKVGGKRRIDIPWNMAYGEQGRPPRIPPRSDLVFEIELLAVDNPQPAQKPQLSTEFEGEPQDLGEGLVIRDITRGQGAEGIKIGASVTMHYRGVLAQTGEQFDSSYDRDMPATFQLEEGALIEGFTRGLLGARVGTKRRMEIPSALGYGVRGAPPVIPANADLVFEVEILEFTNPRELSTTWIREEKREDGIVVRIVREGKDDAEPMPEKAVATLHTMGVLEDGTKFDSTFDQGSPAIVPLDQVGIEGWKLGIIGMKPGEIRQIVVPPSLAFGEEGQFPVIPPDATLVFEIELLDWRAPRVFSTEFAGDVVELEAGITYREVKLGEGEPAAEGQMAFIHYLAQLPDGTLVANTFDADNMQVLPLNDQQPLPGLRRAVMGMKPGGVRRVELSAEHAFGAEGNPPLIPADSPIIFEIELIGAQ
ncbi:MAG: FKBP-type peptidyl-prolyl cis-trans isomerase [Phycisphaeraceae bacterium]|nr:FKBP-type peptidyl-prolyl cis-trans isomerase [Phycisphaeraceae bacterium]